MEKLKLATEISQIVKHLCKCLWLFLFRLPLNRRLWIDIHE